MDDKTKKAQEEALEMMNSMMGMCNEQLLEQQQAMMQQMQGGIDMNAMMATAQSMMQNVGQVQADMESMAAEAALKIQNGMGDWSELAAQTMQGSENLFGMSAQDMLTALSQEDGPVLEPGQLKQEWTKLYEKLGQSNTKVVTRDHEAWHPFGILLSGFLSSLNEYDLDVLQVGESEFEKEIVVEILSDSWGIENRDALFEQLEDLLDQGHTGEYAYYVECLLTNTQPDLEDEESANRFKFTKQYSDLLEPVGMLSWDYGRAAMMVRWGYTVGWLNEQESWELLQQISEVASVNFNSWKEFGMGYLFGSLFWISAFDPEEGVSERFYQGKQALEELFSENKEWCNATWLQLEA